jgi:hypothetical protein
MKRTLSYLITSQMAHRGLDEKLNLLQNMDIAHYRYPQNRNIVQEIYSYLWYSLCIEVS